jgi:glutamyl-tRNA reductase
MSSVLVFLGWNHRATPLDLRERLAFSPERAREALEGLFREKVFSEGVIISTCNRAEIYGLTELEDGLTPLSAYLARFHGVDETILRSTALSGRGDVTVRHLFEVAAGLDSMVLGEAQILGQVREAHRRATEARTARTVTNRLFQAALECGKRVRTETELGSKPTSVAGIALSLTGRIFETLAGCRVLLLGAGETVELTASLLVEAGVTDLLFCNRSPEKAAALAAQAGGRTHPWEERVSAFAHVDIVLSATGSPEPVVRAEAVRRLLAHHKRRGPLLVLDLAVPRDVEPEVGDLPDVYRYDLDALGALARKNTAERQAEVPKANAIVDESVLKFEEWLAGLSHVDVLKGLRGKLEEIRLQELERNAGKLGKLGPSERELVQRITESLVAKILHGPTVGLKEGDPSERLERAAAVRALFRLDRPDGEKK